MISTGDGVGREGCAFVVSAGGGRPWGLMVRGVPERIVVVRERCPEFGGSFDIVASASALPTVRPMEDEITHADRVDRWLGKAAKGLSKERRVLLFEQALGALWRGAHVTLGGITLGAVTERVLYYSTEKYPFLSPLKIEADGVQFEELKKSLPAVKDATITEAFRFVLIEFLSVLGNLTAEIITPELHAELSKVAITGEKHSQPPPSRQGEEEGPQ